MNKITKFACAAIIAFASMSASGTSSFAGQIAGSMTTGSITSQPIGHDLFCQQFPSECNVKSTRINAPVLTKKRWAEMQKVNNHANLSIKPVTDADFYGVEEHWTYPRDYGDCEDYVLIKRYMLMREGWPASSLLITVVKQSNGEGHAVLTVRTSKGDFILDNLRPRIDRWNKTPYRYLKRQSPSHSGKWETIYDPRARVANY